MPETTTIWLPDAKATERAGGSLAKTLYRFPVDILLSGDLGAGKTTFTQAFATAEGIAELVTSPTYALEQRYRTADGRAFIHLDLYRLEERHLGELLAASDDHTGIRCIEWADRLPAHLRAVHPEITLRFAEKNGGREIAITFDDIALPSRAAIETWRQEVLLPDHIARHCDAVAAFAVRLSEELLERGTIVRIEALRRAGEAHDLLRFIDFRPGAGPEHHAHTPEQEKTFERYKTRYPGKRHEAACAAFLREHGFPELAEIVAVHGLTLPTPERTTVEQKLLFYADKRMKIDEVVSLDERFADFAKRYNGSPESARSHIWYEEAKRIEKELFPEGVPF